METGGGRGEAAAEESGTHLCGTHKQRVLKSEIFSDHNRMMLKVDTNISMLLFVTLSTSPESVEYTMSPYLG